MTDQEYEDRRNNQIQSNTYKGGQATGARWSIGLDNPATKRRLGIVLGMGLLLTVIEMVYHYDPGNPSLFETEFWQRIPIYGLLLPLITWILLEWIERGAKVGNQTFQGMERLLADRVETTSEGILEERHRIAQDLHDSLAQNISYLRLKLDQFSEDRRLRETADIQQEINYMRDVANEAYEQIRGTLTTLDPTCQSDLAETLRGSAMDIGERAGFAVVLESQPDRFPLDPEVCRQMIFICQEALYNVEKHAQAQVVNIQVDWGEKELTLCIADDGSGFDPDEVPTDGHLGLAIMSQRAQSIDGQLTIDSRTGSGTRVTLRVPVSGSINWEPCASQGSEGQKSTK